MRTFHILLLAGGALAAFWAYDKYVKPAAQDFNSVSYMYNEMKNDYAAAQGTLSGVEAGAKIGAQDVVSNLEQFPQIVYRDITGIDLTTAGITKTLFGWI